MAKIEYYFIVYRRIRSDMVSSCVIDIHPFDWLHKKKGSNRNPHMGLPIGTDEGV